MAGADNRRYVGTSWPPTGGEADIARCKQRSNDPVPYGALAHAGRRRIAVGVSRWMRTAERREPGHAAGVDGPSLDSEHRWPAIYSGVAADFSSTERGPKPYQPGDKRGAGSADNPCVAADLRYP